MRYSEFKIVESQLLTESSTTRITAGGRTYEVGNDLIKQGGVYAIFSGDSARRYAQANGFVVPPREVLQEVYSQGRQLEMPTRPNNPTDTNAQAHHDQIIEKNGNIPSGLVYGHKKEICEGGGTRLFGGIVNGRQLQAGTRSQHGGGYVDYSQGLRTCKLLDEDQSADSRQETRAATPTVSTRGASQDTDQEELTAGPPYPPEDVDSVKALQRKLQELGYSVGSTGIDGKYGPRTTRAVRAFKRDYNIQGDGLTADAATLQKLDSVISGATPRIERPTSIVPGSDGLEYPISNSRIESIIRDEAELRGIDPDIAVRIFRAEGRSSYQSTVPRTGRGSLNGREASFGPYQLYIGGGLGNDYQDQTGRDLTQDNTEDGITNQIRFALDAAVRQSWQPWYGRGPAGVGRYDGLGGARQARNWS